MEGQTTHTLSRETAFLQAGHWGSCLKTHILSSPVVNWEPTNVGPSVDSEQPVPPSLPQRGLPGFGETGQSWVQNVTTRKHESREECKWSRTEVGEQIPTRIQGQSERRML